LEKRGREEAARLSTGETRRERAVRNVATTEPRTKSETRRMSPVFFSSED